MRVITCFTWKTLCTEVDLCGSFRWNNSKMRHLDFYLRRLTREDHEAVSSLLLHYANEEITSKALNLSVVEKKLLVETNTMVTIRVFNIWPWWPLRHFVRPQLFYLNTEIIINPLSQGFPTCGTQRYSMLYASNFHFFTKTGIPSFLVYVWGFVSKYIFL